MTWQEHPSGPVKILSTGGINAISPAMFPALHKKLTLRVYLRSLANMLRG